MQKLFRSLIAVGGLAGLVACGDDVSITPPANPLTISGAPVTAVQVGSTVQLQSNKAATWTSSASSVATVDATGLVTAVAAGTASITATSTADVNEKASVTITVTAPAVRNVTVSPPNAVMLPGETQGFVANVDADAGVARTVTWSSTNTAVATVTAAGVVTAVAPGATSIVATSTANTAVTGAAAVTVRTPTPATISVQNITITGTNGNTANVNNIAGSIDVNMNVDPGEQVVTRVEVLIDGNVACTQNLSGAQSQALRVAAAFDEIEEVIVSCQINTAAFSATTGIADFFNGSHTLSARAVLASGSDVATPSTPLVFNNQSGVIVTLTNTNGSDPAAAINPATGLQWIGGGVTLNVVGVSYVSGTTVATVTCSIFGKTPTITLTNGTGSVVWTEATANWTAGNSSVTNYLSPGAESVACPSAVLSNGQPMPITVPGTTPVLNFGAPGTTNAAMPILQVVRLDNVGPGLNSANGTLQTALAINPATLPVWVNANTAFTTGNAGIPSQNTQNASDIGSDAVTVTVHVTNATTTALTGASGSCNITGLTAVTSGSQLAATTVSTVYQARVVFKDGLGNIACLDLAPGGVVSGTFGADFVAPTFTTVTGPAANSGAAAPVATFTVNGLSDNASGFSGTPLLVSIKLDQISGQTCFTGAGAACNAVAVINGTPSIGPNQGYYTATITLVDQAGNPTTVTTDRIYLFDNTNPSFSGGISLPSVIAGAATNTFTASVADNLDLNRIFGHVAYPIGISLEYPSQSIGAFGLPFETTAANFNYAVADWIRCINNPNDFATTTNQPTAITLVVSDQANNTASLASGAFGVNAQTCGAVGNVLPGELNTFGPTTLVFAAGKTQVDLDGASLAGASATNVTLRTVADVDLNTSVDPFTRVDYYYQDPTTLRLVKIGTATSLLAQTPTLRTYTYDFVWDPAAPVPTGAINVLAIGVDAQGDAVAAFAAAVTIVP